MLRCLEVIGACPLSRQATRGVGLIDASPGEGASVSVEIEFDGRHYTLP